MSFTFQENFSEVKDRIAPPELVSFYDVPSGRPTSWQVDTEAEAMPSPKIETTIYRWYLLDHLEEDQLMILGLKGAMYGVRRVDEDHLKLWTSRGGANKQPTPFVGTLDNFGIFDTNPMSGPEPHVDFYPRIIALVSPEVRAHISMPYFEYNDDGILQPPTSVWNGSVQTIEIGTVKHRQ